MIEKMPQFLRDFSKEESQEERDITAKRIKAKRGEYFSKREEGEKEYEELDKETIEREKELSAKLDSIKSLENKIEELSTSKFRKLFNYFKLKKTESLASTEKIIYKNMKDLQDTQVFEKERKIKELELKETPLELKEAELMLNNFYEEEKRKWGNSEYTKEDITKNFSEENLASLSLDEYSLLLKRFPGEMVTHVTRQGVRDHIGHMYHTGGQGEYANGFMKMTEDGRLRSALGVCLIEKEKEKAIANFLGLKDFETKEEALEELKIITSDSQNKPGDYVDKSSIHFATEEVADSYYGSEKGNEIFIAFPSAYIASQYYFSGQLNESGGGYWNDQWVWANEEKGMDLNAGLIFIPEETKLDKETGSRYELDENKKPLKNEKYKNLFEKVIDSEDFEEFSKEAVEILGKLQISANEILSQDDYDLSSTDQKDKEKLEPFRLKFEQKFNITDRRLQMAILDYNSLFTLRTMKKNREEGESYNSGLRIEESIDLEIENSMKKGGILYKESENVVSSKEFWENYFENNPDKKPSKIIYYKGIDPTQAFLHWKDEQGINKKSEDKSIGFSERNIGRTEPQATAGINRFKSIAEKVIENHFMQK